MQYRPGTYEDSSETMKKDSMKAVRRMAASSILVDVFSSA